MIACPQRPSNVEHDTELCVSLRRAKSMTLAPARPLFLLSASGRFMFSSLRCSVPYTFTLRLALLLCSFYIRRANAVIVPASSSAWKFSGAKFDQQVVSGCTQSTVSESVAFLQPGSVAELLFEGKLKHTSRSLLIIAFYPLAGTTLTVHVRSSPIGAQALILIDDDIAQRVRAKLQGGNLDQCLTIVELEAMQDDVHRLQIVIPMTDNAGMTFPLAFIE